MQVHLHRYESEDSRAVGKRKKAKTDKTFMVFVKSYVNRKIRTRKGNKDLPSHTERDCSYSSSAAIALAENPGSASRCFLVTVEKVCFVPSAAFTWTVHKLSLPS